MCKVCVEMYSFGHYDFKFTLLPPKTNENVNATVGCVYDFQSIVEWREQLYICTSLYSKIVQYITIGLNGSFQ